MERLVDGFHLALSLLFGERGIVTNCLHLRA
jgi:hypothetical protein